tara:strand:+ start:203 stop:532 length:330 start_codon:yes stop_codon:yes gene_type:complete
MGYLYLAIAIITEVIGTSALKASEGFTKVGPSALVVIGYAVSFYFLALVLKTIPIGIAYAIWAGLGIVLIAAVGILFFKQTPDTPALIGMALIILGVVVIHIFSKTGNH